MAVELKRGLLDRRCNYLRKTGQSPRLSLETKEGKVLPDQDKT